MIKQAYTLIRSVVYIITKFSKGFMFQSRLALNSSRLLTQYLGRNAINRSDVCSVWYWKQGNMTGLLVAGTVLRLEVGLSLYLCVVYILSLYWLLNINFLLLRPLYFLQLGLRRIYVSYPQPLSWGSSHWKPSNEHRIRLTRIPEFLFKFFQCG